MWLPASSVLLAARCCCHTGYTPFPWPLLLLLPPAHPLLQVKNKMSKADFLRNNRGINDGGDLPQVRPGQVE